MAVQDFTPEEKKLALSAIEAMSSVAKSIRAMFSASQKSSVRRRGSSLDRPRFPYSDAVRSPSKQKVSIPSRQV